MKSKTTATADEAPGEAEVLRSGWSAAGKCQPRLAAGVSDDPDRAARDRLRHLRAHAAADGDSHRPQWRASVLGKPAKGAVTDLATAGTDQFLDEAFVKRFLTSYLNYSPADVDDHWASSLNMMTRNLRAYTMKAMADDNTRGKIDDGQIQSVFHLREIDAVSGEPLTYLVYGVKDVHHLSNGTESPITS